MDYSLAVRANATHSEPPTRFNVAQCTVRNLTLTVPRASPPLSALWVASNLDGGTQSGATGCTLAWHRL